MLKSLRVRRRLFQSAGLAALTLAGCGGTIPKTRYYVLQLPVAAPQPRTPAPYTLVVMPFRAPEHLNQDRIVFRPSPVEVDYYEYHRWAQRPPEAITSALIERLRAQQLFAGVSAFDGRVKGDYLMRSRLERLEEIDSPESVNIRVEVAADAIDVKTNRIIWSGSGSHSGAVTHGEVRAVVEELSRGVDASLAQLVKGLAEFAKALPPAPAPASSESR